MEEKPEGGKPVIKSEEEKKPALKWHYLHDLNVANEFYLEFRVISGHIVNTVATDVSLHCLQSGADIRERPVVAGITWYHLDLWGKTEEEGESDGN